MVKVNVFIRDISAERLWEIDKNIPPVKVSTNLNVVGVKKKGRSKLEVPFVFTINYSPPVAQISVKGKAHIRGKREELKKIHSSYTEKKPPPQVVVQSISNTAFLESVIISRTLRIPPPIPLPKISAQKEKKRPEPSYRA
ncbi:hypothetical protein GWN63_03510 [Candidatus Bathyarchaeota archaeon]|nr:hypothetical protein [Candidatus Bathyarchaeota archaeon]NIU81297.1 hypothetical protein [Candidatus Bathyarchaeota archaeon]NIV67932.1 hypothetical protein [Candidatus Bathyarchaeota archaeon]NIW16373.1 hypothetical protein [Candidatus Bathyarchaeota archaeon]